MLINRSTHKSRRHSFFWQRYHYFSNVNVLKLCAKHLHNPVRHKTFSHATIYEQHMFSAKKWQKLFHKKIQMPWKKAQNSLRNQKWFTWEENMRQEQILWNGRRTGLNWKLIFQNKRFVYIRINISFYFWAPLEKTFEKESKYEVYWCVQRGLGVMRLRNWIGIKYSKPSGIRIWRRPKILRKVFSGGFASAEFKIKWY